MILASDSAFRLRLWQSTRCDSSEPAAATFRVADLRCAQPKPTPHGTVSPQLNPENRQWFRRVFSFQRLSAQLACCVFLFRCLGGNIGLWDFPHFGGSRGGCDVSTQITLDGRGPPGCDRCSGGRAVSRSGFRWARNAARRPGHVSRRTRYVSRRSRHVSWRAGTRIRRTWFSRHGRLGRHARGLGAWGLRRSKRPDPANRSSASSTGYESRRQDFAQRDQPHATNRLRGIGSEGRPEPLRVDFDRGPARQACAPQFATARRDARGR